MLQALVRLSTGEKCNNSLLRKAAISEWSQPTLPDSPLGVTVKLLSLGFASLPVLAAPSRRNLGCTFGGDQSFVA